MRTSFLGVALLLVLAPELAHAQDTGLALNAGRGLDNGASVDWTFKEDWTLRPTIAAGYSQQTGFDARLGSTVLRSFGAGHRVYAYVGAGFLYATGRGNNGSNLGGPGQAGGAGAGVGGRIPQGVTSNNLILNEPSAFYLTAPAGLRARIYGNFEAFAEAAYQRTLSGQFPLNQTGQFSGDLNRRFGATFGVSLRLH